MIARMSSRVANERGAVLIQVAVAMLALLALSAFVWDFGVMWASRRQVQNAADAGAHAGAVALAFDNGTDAQVQEKARAVALQNLVWNAAPERSAHGCPHRAVPADTGVWPPDTCVRVEAFRNQQRGNPLPVFFASLVNVARCKECSATATARGVAANAARCLRPWAVADKWLESTPARGRSRSLYQPPATCTRHQHGQSRHRVQQPGRERESRRSWPAGHAQAGALGPPGTPGTLVGMVDGG